MSYSKIEHDENGSTYVQNFTVSPEGGMVMREPFCDAVIVQIQKVMTDEGEKIVPIVSVMLLNADMEPHLREYAHHIFRSFRC